MAASESIVESFIIKFWLEETVEETGQTLWRGRITHVPSGEQEHFQNLCHIPEFITPYLEGMDVKKSFRYQLCRRLAQWSKFSRRNR